MGRILLAVGSVVVLFLVGLWGFVSLFPPVSYRVEMEDLLKQKSSPPESPSMIYLIVVALIVIVLGVIVTLLAFTQSYAPPHS